MQILLMCYPGKFRSGITILILSVVIPNIYCNALVIPSMFTDEDIADMCSHECAIPAFLTGFYLTSSKSTP